MGGLDKITFQWIRSIEKMPSVNIKMNGRCGVFCIFCKKKMSEKEGGMHLFVCEKVSQELFQPRTPLGGSSVSLGTTNNSSRTNPLLGPPVDK